MKKIVILTGGTGTGKTTALAEQFKDRKDVSGILQPVINDERVLLFLRTMEEYKLEINDSSEAFIPVGRYKFSKRILDLARDEIELSIEKSINWLIIDEYGRLEMDGSGLEPAVSNRIKTRSHTDARILIVVRDYLLQDFIFKHGLNEKDYVILGKEQIGSIQSGNEN